MLKATNEQFYVTYLFKCENSFKICEYTISQRMIHAAVSPELQNRTPLQT